MDIYPGKFAPASATLLYLIRHGEVDERFRPTWYGQLDVPLSARGHEQSRAAVERLAGIPFDAIYSSDLSRAVVLAELLGEALDLPVRRIEALRERNMGALQGVDPQSPEPEQAALFEQWNADRVHYRVPEGENFPDLHERVVPTMQDLVAAYRGRRIALVCHAGPIRVMLAHALGMPLERIFRLQIGLCSVNVIEFPKDEDPRVTLVNG